MKINCNKLQKPVVLLLIFIANINVSVFAKGFDAKGEKKGEKLRVCFVEARGTYRKAAKYCPILEAKSNIECVIGTDRSDCMRRISKGTAHFGVFSPEDLVAAQWAGVDVLITSEMRFTNEPFQYEVVAVVANDARINSIHDLRGSRFCHPGHGLSRHWTDILANYFESTLVARECEDDLSSTESRIKASSKFLGPSCKPGAWVPDPLQDALLKKRYPSLCEICYNPGSCSRSDKYWGRMGPLYCLTGGDGQVAWVRLDDVKTHFGFSGLQAESDPSLYSFLCIEGHLQPLNTSTPCVWVTQPWPAVAAKREYASVVQLLLEDLSHNDESSWQSALLSLLETYHVNLNQLDTTIPISDYLDQAVGFSSAYSFPSCNPPRAIVYCSTTLIDHVKCSWLQETAGVYGIEPNIQCVREDDLNSCMESTQHRATDVVLVDEKIRLRAEQTYHLKPLLYEYAKRGSDRYTVIAVVKVNSEIYNFEDLYGKRVCMPSYEGAAFLSVLETIRDIRGIKSDKTYSSREVSEFFSENSCLWSSETYGNCKKEYAGDEGALRCLSEGHGDVAFVDMAVFQQFINSNSTFSNLSSKYKLICPYGRSKKSDDLCFLHWWSRGFLMISNQTNLMRRNEIYNSLRDMDRLFGKFYESHILPFSMFGPFDRQHDVMFHDQTDGLRGIIEMEKDRLMPRFLERTFMNYTKVDRQLLISGAPRTLDFNYLFIAFLMLIHYVYSI